VPYTNLVLHDVEEEKTVLHLCHHSEKLAIAFGFINTAPGTPLQIRKNLQVCEDCEMPTKFISKIAFITLKIVSLFLHGLLVMPPDCLVNHFMSVHCA
jgi:hypothetical protein